MGSIRSLATVCAFAAATSAAILTTFWPKVTMADGDESAQSELTLDGTKVKDDVVVNGDLVRDPKAKSGWIMRVEAENRGQQEATAELETDLIRQVSNPMSRAVPMPTAMLKKKETLTIAAGEKVVRTYEVPVALVAQINAAERARLKMQKLAEAGKYPKLPPRVTYFGVAFKGPWSNETTPWDLPGPARKAVASADRL